MSGAWMEDGWRTACWNLEAALPFTAWEPRHCRISPPSEIPISRVCFLCCEWDKHWYSTEQTESSVRLREGLLATQTGDDEVGMKFTQPPGFAYSSFFLTLPKPCPLAIWAFAFLWRLSHSLTALKLETSSSSRPWSITSSSHPLAFVSTISPAYVLPLGLDSNQTSPSFVKENKPKPSIHFLSVRPFFPPAHFYIRIYTWSQ